jgi:acyl-CoA dehydrogenase
MDVAGNKAAQNEIAMIKVVTPNVACRVLDWAIQVFGAAGVSDDFGLAYAYASARTLRLADGPDEVHRNHIAKFELGRHSGVAHGRESDDGSRIESRAQAARPPGHGA